MNRWAWEFGLGKPCLGVLSLSVTETEEWQIAVMIEAISVPSESTRAKHSHKAQNEKAAAEQ